MLGTHPCKLNKVYIKKIKYFFQFFSETNCVILTITGSFESLIRLAYFSIGDLSKKLI